MKPSHASILESLEPRRHFTCTPTDTLVQLPAPLPVYVGGSDHSDTVPGVWIVGRDPNRFNESSNATADPELQAFFDAQGLGIQFDRYLGSKWVFTINAPLSLTKDQLIAALSSLDGFQSVDPDHVIYINDPVYPQPPTLVEVIHSPGDLFLTSLSADSTAAAGGILTAQFSYDSTGFFLNAAYVRVSFALSPDATAGNADDIPLGGYMVPLGATSSPITTTLRLPDDLPAGSYHLVATIDADAAVAESNETNNTFVGLSVDVTPAAPRDLTLTGVNLAPDAPAAYVAGGTIRPFASARIARAFARGVQIAYALSLDDIVGNEDDIPLGTAAGWADSSLHYSGEALPMFYPPSFTIPASVAPGTYHLVATVDPANQVAESDETNNTAVGPTITVQQPTPAQIPETPPYTPVEMTLPDPPPSVCVGTSATASVTLTNPSTKHRKVRHAVTFYLSDDATLNSGDVRFARQTIAVPLKPGQTQSQPLTYKLPADAATGTRYVIAVTDTGTTTVTPVTIIAPRLTAAVLSAAPAKHGNRTRVTVQITNTGTGRSVTPATLRVLGTGDHVLAVLRRRFSLAAGELTTLDLLLRPSESYSVALT